jgi:Gas vesicle synthesis protein GvpL/GvpF
VPDLIYLYGFAPAGVHAPTNELSGISDQPIELLETNGLTAIISRVDEDTYGSQQIEERLEDLGWVAQQGLAHERVVAWFVDLAQIIPASLFTLYSSQRALESSIASQRSVIGAELQRLAGQREWDVKVSYDASALAEHSGNYSEAVRKLDEEIKTAPPGRKYLLERKRTDLAKSEVIRVARELGQQIFEQATPICTDAITLPIPQTGEHLPVVLHAAMLVARDREAELVERLERARDESQSNGVHVTFSGPWAPYRFVRHE